MTSSPNAFPTTYYSNVNRDLLEKIPLGIRNILEVGCGAGAFGSAYKQINPQCFYAGIELMPDPAKSAADKLDAVINSEVEKVSFADIANNGEKFDCIVYGDVLEHLMYPWDVLKDHKNWLKPDGTIVACIPNIQLWSVIKDLIAGQWRYTDSGIMDRTHIRFFTAKSLTEYFQYAGFRIELMTTRVIDGFLVHQGMHIDEFFTLITPLLNRLNLDLATSKAMLKALQYVVIAKPM